MLDVLNTSMQLPSSTVTIMYTNVYVVYFSFYCQRESLSHAVMDAMFSDDRE